MPTPTFELDLQVQHGPGLVMDRRGEAYATHSDISAGAYLTGVLSQRIFQLLDLNGYFLWDSRILPFPSVFLLLNQGNLSLRL